jgi:SAM-dependent methyltransferase
LSAPRSSAAKPPAKLRAALARLPLDRMRVLECASGPGLYLQHFGTGSIGLDSSEEACAKAASIPLQVRHCDLDQENWANALADDEPFEAAWLCDVLMHVASPEGFLAQLPAQLAPGAPVLSIEWTLPRKGRLIGLRTFLSRCIPGTRVAMSEPTHLRYFTQEEVETLLKEAGFIIEKRWLHSFSGILGARFWTMLVHSFWPVQTILARAPACK